eukprot:CAMPEP_0176327334 /NCGR_PEP_ID=MMETSP0121_2-20121125/74393_1 /TAXON_ID=160619 /ORGANISM="Kryptoperidinium foliaceum, Strain CCMP 1326" /LENGTH=47 /DNA_ID= /DNA_START= /DNA_END= /DNA_ORIENTATION=
MTPSFVLQRGRCRRELADMDEPRTPSQGRPASPSGPAAAGARPAHVL